MPDVLLLYKDSYWHAKLEELVQNKGFEARSTPDSNQARQWVQNGPFSAALVEINFPFQLQQELASAIWDKNELAPFILYDLSDGIGNAITEMRLFGADLARGANALNAIRDILGRVTPSTRAPADTFNILVVEDQDGPRDIICTYIESLGYPKVKGCPSVPSAMQELNQGNFSCILTDVQMPGQTGRELIETVRANAKLKHLPIIVLTAFGTGDCLVDCLNAGASGFLVKPPKRKDLLRELQRAQRIISHRSNPRLARPEEVGLMRDALAQKGLV